MFQHIQTNKYNLLYKHTQGHKPHDNFNSCRKGLWQVQHSLRIKTMKKLGVEETYLNILTDTHDMPNSRVNTILKEEKLAFSLKSGPR